MKSTITKFTSALAASVMMIGVFQSAHAADMLEEGSPVFTDVEFGTGWYLRGDVGATRNDVASSLPDATEDDTLGAATSFGFGGGYTFGNGLRGEAQFSYLTGLTDSSAQDENCLAYDRGDGLGPRADQGYCYYKTRADVTVTSFMANIYLDGPTYANITPYVGVGAGLSLVQWNDYKDYDLCIGQTSNEDCRGLGGGIHVLREGEATTESAIAPSWNVMLGAAYQINKNLKLDVGYRYLSTAETTIAKAANNTFFQRDQNADGMSIHEIRVGLRYEIW